MDAGRRAPWPAAAGLLALLAGCAPPAEEPTAPTLAEPPGEETRLVMAPALPGRRFGIPSAALLAEAARPVPATVAGPVTMPIAPPPPMPTAPIPAAAPAPATLPSPEAATLPIVAAPPAPAPAGPVVVPVPAPAPLPAVIPAEPAVLPIAVVAVPPPAPEPDAAEPTPSVAAAPPPPPPPAVAAPARPLPAPPARPASPGGSGAAVQLVAAGSEAEALAHWDGFARRQPALAAGRTPLVQRVERAGQSAIFRLRVGGFAGRDEAERYCAELRGQSVACWVASGG